MTISSGQRPAGRGAGGGGVLLLTPTRQAQAWPLSEHLNQRASWRHSGMGSMLSIAQMKNWNGQNLNWLSEITAAREGRAS